MADLKAIIVIALIIAGIYFFALPPATKEKVNNTMSVAKEIGGNVLQAVGGEKGKVNCTTDSQCHTQYGNNTICNTVSGTCFSKG